MAECIHGLDDSWCAVCLHGAVKQETRFAGLVEARAAAKYEGKCANCGDPIEIGDPLVLVDGSWICADHRP